MNDKTAKALKPYDSIVTATMSKIQAMQNNNQIQFPGDYSPANALQSAWLILQETVDKDKKPVLETCSKASIANSLLDMVISGLSPAKHQGYFIPYGGKLSWTQSYFGSMALAKRVDPRIADEGIIAEVIYEDDKLEFEIVKGKKVISRHQQTLESIAKGQIKGAYCQIISHDGEILRTEIMAMEEIKKSWSKSKMNPIENNGDIKASSTHGKHTVEMCKRTVINRTCKPIINSSSDKVLLESVNRSDMMDVEAQAEQDIETGANREIIDIERAKATDETTGEEQESSPDTNHVEQRNEPLEDDKTNGGGPGF